MQSAHQTRQNSTWLLLASNEDIVTTLVYPTLLTCYAGHVDAGKSTLMGHFLQDLGQVSEKTIKKYEREARKIGKSSFAYAWVLDETGEERSR